MRTMAREEDVAELRRRLRLVREDGRRRWGRMTAHQMICHLADAYRMAVGEKSVSLAVNVFGRTVVKGIALYMPLPWPPGIATRPEVDALLGGTAPTTFAEDLAQVDVQMERFLAAPLDLWHPLFGPMSRADWLRWGWLHTDHHLRQFGA
jgi:DinB family protein